MKTEENNLDEIIRLMRLDSSMDAPAESVQWAKNLYRARLQSPKPSLFREIIAVLQANLSPDVALSGERSGAAGQERQMLFDAGDYAIDLRIAKSGKSFTLRGQILGGDNSKPVAYLRSDSSTFSSETSDFGEFSIRNLNAGIYSLNVMIDGSTVVIESLEIG